MRRIGGGEKRGSMKKSKKEEEALAKGVCFKLLMGDGEGGSVLLFGAALKSCGTLGDARLVLEVLQRIKLGRGSLKQHHLIVEHTDKTTLPSIPL